jgi:hypothetical protein
MKGRPPVFFEHGASGNNEVGPEGLGRKEGRKEEREKRMVGWMDG